MDVNVTLKGIRVRGEVLAYRSRAESALSTVWLRLSRVGIAWPVGHNPIIATTLHTPIHGGYAPDRVLPRCA